VTVEIGGWLDPISGDPFEVSGRIEFLGGAEWVETGPMGRGAHEKVDMRASLDLGENRHVVVTERLSAPMSADPLKALGLDVDSFDIVEIKSRVHHKAYWSGLDENTGTVRYIDYPVDPPGIAPADLMLLEYENAPWDAYPIGEKYRT
jgi:microcystin degradation protein MlrC